MGVNFSSGSLADLNNKTQFIDTSGELTGSIFGGSYQILDADVGAAAAIAQTKLSPLNIVNADINASAGIALSKLASLPAATKTGTYVGDGSTSKAISGLGFAPSYVRIWRVRATQGSTEADECLDELGSGWCISIQDTRFQFYEDKILSLDADGFTVSDDSSDNDPNTNGTTYAYLALS